MIWQYQFWQCYVYFQLCIHCSTTHNQEKGSVLSIENKPKTSVKEERISKAMKSYLEKRKKAGLYMS